MPQRITLDEKKTRNRPSSEVATMAKIERIMAEHVLSPKERSRIASWFYDRWGYTTTEVQPETILTGD